MRAVSKVGLIAAASLLVFVSSFTIHAQGGVVCHTCPQPVAPPTPKQPTIPHRPKQQPHTTIRTGALTILAEPGASVRLESLSHGGAPKGCKVPEDEPGCIINDLAPGRYRATAELNGYKPAVGEKQVAAKSAEILDLKMEPHTYNVTIRVNADNGNLFYTTGGKEYSYAPVQNGMARLSNLISGDYTVTIEPKDASYKPLTRTLRVPGDGTEVSYNLEKLEESKDFLGASASAWDLPNGWSFSSGKVMVRGRGMALPRNSDYRNYKDFQISTDMRMMNGVSASFIVHEVDSQNYYLVQITGPNADEQYVLRGYLYRNGLPQRMEPTIPISQFSDTLKPGKFFHVVLTMTSSEISVRVVDSETGALRKLGTLFDPSKAFSLGAVGVAARDNEQNEVGQFIICSAESMRARKCGD